MHCAFCRDCIFSLAGLSPSGVPLPPPAGGGVPDAWGVCPLCRADAHGTQIAYAPHPLRLPLPAAALPAALLPVVPPRKRAIKVGSLVRVRPGLVPRYGWGRATGASVGRVVSLTAEVGEGGRDFVARVNFPEQNGWAGVCSELDALD